MKTNFIPFLSLVVLMVTAANAQNCGFREEVPTTTTAIPITTTTSTWSPLHDTFEHEVKTSTHLKNTDQKRKSRTIYIYDVRETQSTEIPFAVLEVYNVVWIQPKMTHVRVEVGEDQMARFYLTPSFKEYTDTHRDGHKYADMLIRCTDGTTTETLYVSIIDENTRAPIFSPSNMALTVPQQWPPEVPINLQKPIFVRDLDYSLEFARVTITASPAFVSVVTSPLFVEGSGSVPYDYKVELFVAAGVDAGDYNVWLSATDGTHVVPYAISLKVTEVVCKGQKVDPVFGLKGKTNKILYYNSTLNTVPKEGDTLPGVAVQAFNPEDDACSIELSIQNTDNLRVSTLTGEVTFTRRLTLAEIEELGRTWIVEIVATDGEAGKSTTVPLVITNDFEAIHESI